jgi:hypothetical protein
MGRKLARLAGRLGCLAMSSYVARPHVLADQFVPGYRTVLCGGRAMKRTSLPLLRRQFIRRRGGRLAAGRASAAGGETADHRVSGHDLGFAPPGERNDDDFDVLVDGVVVGRIMKSCRP